MTEVWSLLREDSGASFSQLHVPPARGKGFKLDPLERMYLLVKVRSDNGLKPESWRNHTAANMWGEGVGDIIEETVPSKSKRLKEILDSTAAGAHDKPATSETELKAAVKDLRALLAPLRLGAG